MSNSMELKRLLNDIAYMATSCLFPLCFCRKFFPCEVYGTSKIEHIPAWLWVQLILVEMINPCAQLWFCFVYICTVDSGLYRLKLFLLHATRFFSMLMTWRNILVLLTRLGLSLSSDLMSSWIFPLQVKLAGISASHFYFLTVIWGPVFS